MRARSTTLVLTLSLAVAALCSGPASLDSGAANAKHGNNTSPTSKQPDAASSPLEDGCPTMEEAYGKFKGDMQRIEHLMDQAQKRAQAAEVQAEREREAASQCLSAQKMLKGPEADAAADMESEIQRQVAKATEKHEYDVQQMKADMETKLQEAVRSEKNRQVEHSGAMLKEVRLNSATAVRKWQQRVENLEADNVAMKATTRLKVVRLETDLKEAQGNAMTGLAGARRAREADASGSQMLKWSNQNNLEAAQLLREQLQAKTEEAATCAKACGGPQKVTFTDDPDQPCPGRMAHLLDQVKETKESNKRFEKKTLQRDQRLVRTRVQLKATREEIRRLQDEVDECKSQGVKGTKTSSANSLVEQKIHQMSTPQKKLSVTRALNSTAAHSTNSTEAE